MATHLSNKDYQESKNNTVRPEDVINRAINGEDIRDFLIILPTGRQVYQLKRQFIKTYHNKKNGAPIVQPDILTLKQLSNRILHKLYPSNTPYVISDSFRRILIEESLYEITPKHFLIKEDSYPQSLIERIDKVIMGIKEDGITPEKIQKDLAGEDISDIFDINKHTDIYDIYKKYQELLKDSNGKTRYVDEVELLKIIVQNPELNKVSEDTQNEIDFSGIPQNSSDFFDKLFANKKFILFYGFTEFKHYEIELLKLMSSAKIPILINIDYTPENGPLFGNLHAPINELTKTYTRDTVEGQNEQEFSHSEYIRKYLFNTEKNRSNSELSKKIEIYQCESRKDEVKVISKYIRYLIQEKGYRPNDIAIAIRNHDYYSNRFREQLYLDSIPFDISDRLPLKKSPITATVFGILNLGRNHFFYKDVHKVLKNRYLHFPNAATDFNPDNIMKIADDLRIRGGIRQGGRSFWIRRFTANIEYIENELSNNFLDKLERNNLEKQRENCIKAIRDFKVLYKSITINFETSCTALEFKDIIIKEIFEKFNIKKTAENDYENLTNKRNKYSENDYLLTHDSIEQDVRATLQFEKMLNEMCNALHIRNPKRKYKFQELVDRLWTAVESEKYQIREKRSFGVTVTSMEQLRGMKFKVNILCGAIDGDIPTKYNADKFLGKHLPDSEERKFNSERLEFYQFLTSNRASLNADDSDSQTPHKVIITYANYEGSKKLVASSFVNSLLNILVPREKIFPNEKELEDNHDIKFIKVINFQDDRTNTPHWIHTLTNRPELISKLAFDEKYSGKSQLWSSELFRNYINQNDNFEKLYKSLKINDDNNQDIIDTNQLLENDLANLKTLEKDKHIYSASELESYAKCPYRYFVSRLLTIPSDEKESDEDALSPIEKGNDIHNILYRFYTQIQKNHQQSSWLPTQKKYANLPDIKPVQLDLKMADEYRNMLLKISQEVLDKYHTKSNKFMEMELEAIMGKDGKKGSLEKWLDGELERVRNSKDGKQFQPSAFEFAFGYSNKDNSIKPIEINGVQLKGKVDRIEFSKDDYSQTLLIGDYKSKLKKLPGNNKIEEGKALQIPLYMMAVQNIIKQYYDCDVSTLAGGIYYSTNPEYSKGKMNYFQMIMFNNEVDFPGRPSIRTSSQILANSDIVDDYLNIVKEKVAKYAEDIENLKFQPTPSKENCAYCSYSSLCGVGIN